MDGGGLEQELCPSLAVFCPEVLQKVTLSFPSKRQATCLGRLADAIENNEPGTPHNALLVVSSDVTTDPVSYLLNFIVYRILQLPFTNGMTSFFMFSHALNSTLD